MFQLLSSPINILQFRKKFDSPSVGAFVSFEGLVRDLNEGENVLALEYEAHEALCLSEAQKIFNEIKEKFDVLEVQCVHRVGKLKIQDLAVWVGVCAAHRDDAFKACRYTIDEIKSRLPIWKKEYYQNGDSGWINCQPDCEKQHVQN